ncbi:MULTISPECIES: hypothetical protein [Rufibacter]|uniref:Uncharacterized protein n=1 Tax=Rufibacter quisquiliarum TaxID=1549639 RepID=A0A839GC04_9BACT|nr:MULTISPECIES: hypothetical protein [Rufibacter]MBA9075850.1 hypothetical protein [Rufibacter quisquiliarum]
MNVSVKKKVAGQPIEKLLKDSQLLPVDKTFVNASMAKLQALRQQYMQAPDAGKSVFKLKQVPKKKK